MQRSVKFYRDELGFQTEEKEDCPKVIFFNTTGTKFELYPLELLAQDISESNPPKIGNGFCGITLAYNVKSEAEVIKTIETARNAGANIVKEPQKFFGVAFMPILPTPIIIIGR